MVIQMRRKELYKTQRNLALLLRFRWGLWRHIFNDGTYCMVS